MSKLITQIKRFALALCLATPIVSWAAYTTTGYEDFGNTAGVVLWRTTTEGNFSGGAVIAIAEDGTPGEAGTLTWGQFSNGQAAFSAPGKVLVYDKASSDDETPVYYTQNPTLDFRPISFGGMWVKTLAASGNPFGIVGTNDRRAEFGSAGYTTLFKFEKSYTLDLQGAFTFNGTVNVDVAQDAVFSINASYPHQTITVTSGSTLKPTGAGSITIGNTDNGLIVNGTLDLSAETRPTLTGMVKIPAGATLVVPAGTAPTTESPFTVCTGTLTVDGDIYVKVGDADAAIATVIVNGGAITGFEFPTTEKTFDGSEDWPTTVPALYTYTFVGSDDPEAPTEVSTGVSVSGTLKTTGYISLTGLEVKTGGTLEVVDGNTTATAATNGYGDKLIDGNVIVRAGATLTTTQNDFLDWYGASSQRLDIYGTLALGNSRWSVKTATACTFNFYPGARVTGSGDENGVIDLIAADSKLSIYAGDNGGEVVIEGKVKTRNANTPIWVDANTTLKLNGGFNGSHSGAVGGINKSGDGTLEITGTVSSPAASTVSEGTVAFVDTTVALPLTVNAGKTVTVSASEGVTVPLNVTMNASANITVSGAGTVNGSVTFGGFPTGTLTGLTTSTWQGTVTVPAASGNISKLASCGNADSVIDFAGTTGSSYIMASGNTTYNVGAINFSGATVLDNGSSGSTVNFAKISGDGDLTLSSWGGCSSARYNLNKVEGYTGTLTVKNGITRDQGGTFTIGIGNIVTENTTPGACVLPIVSESVESPTGTVVYNLDKATLNGEAADLEVREGGIYVAEPAPTSVTVTVPVVANTTVTVTAGEETVEPDTEGGNVYTVDYGSAVVVTYTVDGDAYSITGGTIEFTATEDATVTEPTVTPYVAWIYGENDQILETNGKFKTVLPALIAFGNGTGAKIRFAEALTEDQHNQLMDGCSYDAGTITYTRLPTVATITTGAWVHKYTSLAAAIGDATDGDTIVLVADVDVVSTGLTFPAGKAITFDLNGKTLTAGNGATSHVQVNGVVTITDSSEGALGKIVSAEVGTYGLVQVAENNTQEGAALTIAGGTIEAYFPDTLNDDNQHPAYGVAIKGKDTVFNMTGGKVKAGLMAIMGHGSKASGGTYTISGGTIESVDDFAMYLPTKGGCSVTISGGTFVGQGAVSARAGTVTVTGGTFTASGDGVAPGTKPGTTGLGFMALAVTPNYAAVEVTVSGGAFTSATGVAAVGLVESTYAGSISLTGGSYSTDVTDFCAKGYAATEADGVWTVAEKKGIDPTDPTSSQEVTPSAAEIEEAGGAEEAAIAKAEVTVPEAVSDEVETAAQAAGKTAEELYKSYFKLDAVETSEGSGVYNVTIADLKEEVKESVSKNAVEELVAAVEDTQAETVTVAVPAGLYYKVETFDTLGGEAVDTESGLSTGTTTAVDKPTGTTQGFIRVTVGPAPIQ